MQSRFRNHAIITVARRKWAGEDHWKHIAVLIGRGRSDNHGSATESDFALEAADRSLVGPGPLGEKPKAEPTDSIRYPKRDPVVYGEAIARLVGSFSGPGFNVIFRPHSDQKLDQKFKLNLPDPDLLELNLTHELWTFPTIKADLGEIPNRVSLPGTEGKAREDAFLRGIPYTQIVRDVTDTSTDKGTRVPVDRLGNSIDKKKRALIQDIHFEPGLLIHVPNSTPVSDQPTINRMASIPHGTTINAQGAAAVRADGTSAPDITFSKFDSKPFKINNSGVVPFFDQNQFDLGNGNATRLPQDMKPFLDRKSIESITVEMVQDPNELIRKHNANKTFSQVIKFKVSTTPIQALEKQACPHLATRAAVDAINTAVTSMDRRIALTTGVVVKNNLEKAKKAIIEALTSVNESVNEPVASLPQSADARAAATAPAIGTANIAFLDGDLAPGANPNARTGKVEATFWISTVKYSLDVKEKFTPGKREDGKDKILQLDPVEKDKFPRDTVPSFVFQQIKWLMWEKVRVKRESQRLYQDWLSELNPNATDEEEVTQEKGAEDEVSEEKGLEEEGLEEEGPEEKGTDSPRDEMQKPYAGAPIVDSTGRNKRTEDISTFHDSAYTSITGTRKTDGPVKPGSELEQPPSAELCSGSPNELHIDEIDVMTTYSDAPSTSTVMQEFYMSQIVDSILSELQLEKNGSHDVYKLLGAMPQMLQAFAHKIGFGAEHVELLDVMAFFNKYRICYDYRKITRCFEERVLPARSEAEERQVTAVREDSISLVEKIDAWNVSKEPPSQAVEEPDEFGIGIDEATELDEQLVKSYQRRIIGTPAHQWLIENLQKEPILQSMEPNTRQRIADEIRTRIRSIPKFRHISRRRAPQPCHAIFEVDWDLIRFLREQEYETPIDESIQAAVDLTGSQVIVKACGTADAIAEVGEQLSWLSSALCPPPFEFAIAFSKPIVDVRLAKVAAAGDATNATPDVICRINTITEGKSDENSYLNGQCWHHMFRNTVVAQGFPIPGQCGEVLGLEIPLDAMAKLLHTKHIEVFYGKLFLKGFSSMLVSTAHLPPGTSSDGVPQQNVTLHADLEVGWSKLPKPHQNCTLDRVSIKAGKIVSGTASIAIGNRVIPRYIPKDSYLRRLQWLCQRYVVLWDEKDKCGWLVDGPRALLYLVRSSLWHNQHDKMRSLFMPCLDAIEEADDVIEILAKRENRMLKLYPELCQQETKTTHNHTLKEQDKDKEDVDKDKEMVTVLTERKEDFYRLQDRVEDIGKMLEKIITVQMDIAEQNGLKLKLRTRKYLEGFDFKDLATIRDPVKPRVAKLAAIGYGWVDFVREIQAVVLFGTGFGELIEPASATVHCKRWSRLPRRRYYLAACVEDIRRIMEAEGDPDTVPMKLSNDLVWHGTSAPFGPCSCKAHPDSKHSDLVQIIWPASLQRLLRKKNPVLLDYRGAVIFGHNIHWPWHWNDFGDPVRGKIPLAAEDTSGDIQGTQSVVKDESSSEDEAAPEVNVESCQRQVSVSTG
ncbi:MAG: hypothetical protein Q9165_007700 [Trypethelium subeluteriae]